MKFSELDALSVMALSIVWIVAVLTVIWGLRLISKVTPAQALKTSIVNIDTMLMYY